MEIKEPRFQKGQKVMYEGNLYIVVEISSYSFSYNEYLYRIEDDVKQCVKSEEELEPYIEKPKSVWELQYGDECFFITATGNVFFGTWDNWNVQIEKRKLGNVFLTKEEAEAEVKRCKIETEMLHLGGRRTFKKGENNWFIYYNDGLNVTVLNESVAQGAIYFDLENEAYNTIKIIGEDRIKKYIFGVNE